MQKAKYITLKILCLILFMALFFGCSATRTISNDTTTTTTIEPVKFDVPDIKQIVILPIVKSDSTIEVYEDEPITFESEDIDGAKIKSIVKAKITIENKGGKKEAKLDIKVQSNVERPAQVTTTKQSSKDETTTFLYDLLNSLKWIIIIFMIIGLLFLIVKAQIKKL